MKVKDIGEQGLLKIVQRFCPPDIIGDDGAIVSIAPDKSVVVTTDVLVDGVHFSDRTTSAPDVGWRAVAANLSDLAAMGATPLAITVGLSLHPETSVLWVEELYEGMSACLQEYNTVIVGGDLVRSPVNSIAITAFGEVNPAQAIKRHHCQPGYIFVATGYHGASRAGLELLLNPQLGANLSKSDRLSLIKAHQRPIPRLDMAHFFTYLAPVWPASQIAGMDSSDGLANAIISICQASGVGAQIDRSKIPIHPAIHEIASPEIGLDWALYGGEDFELILALPPDMALNLTTLTKLGVATVDPSIKLIDNDKIYPDVNLTLDSTFQHY